MTAARTWILACITVLVAARGACAQQPPAAVAAPAAIGDSALDARTAEESSHLRCPVCQGESIQDSPSDLARQMRIVVRSQLQSGKSPADVDAYFVSKYGEWILLEPKNGGFNTLVYAMPIVVVLGGLALITVVVRRWTSQSPTRVPDA